MIGGKKIEGEVYAIDPVTKAIALKQQDETYVIVNIHQVQEIQGDLSKIKHPEDIISGARFSNLIRL